jgi:hypothetical protein
MWVETTHTGMGILQETGGWQGRNTTQTGAPHTQQTHTKRNKHCKIYQSKTGRRQHIKTGNKNHNTHMCELTRTLNTTVHGVSVTILM